MSRECLWLRCIASVAVGLASPVVGLSADQVRALSDEVPIHVPLVVEISSSVADGRKPTITFTPGCDPRDVISPGSDGERLASGGLPVSLTHVDIHPAISSLPNRIVARNTYMATLDLWDYVSDLDDPDSVLSFSIAGNTDPGCGVSISSNRYLEISPSPGWTGLSRVIVRVWDPYGLWDEDEFTIVVADAAESCAGAREYPDGSWVFLQYFATVTAVFPGYFYVEDWDRTSGIRVDCASPPSVSNYVSVAGQLSTYYGERVITAHILHDYGPDPNPPSPFHIRNRFIGGAGPNTYTRRVPEPDGTGCYNVGLLFTTTGKVVETRPPLNDFWVDDGSGAAYSSTLNALLVEWEHAGVPTPPLNARVRLTGIGGATTLSGSTIATFRPRSAADVRGLGGSAAYLYNTDIAAANAFSNLLAEHNWFTTNYSITRFPRSLYHFDVVIIGDDTGTWSDQYHVATVLEAGKPVVAIGAGGARFLDQVPSPDLSIGWNASMISSGAYCWPQNTGLGIWYFDHRIPPQAGQPISIQSSGAWIGVHDPPVAVTRILNDSQHTTHFPLAHQERFMQWGFRGGPSAMTDTGKLLFINSLYYMLGQ